MNIYVDVGGSEALALRGALLVYQGKNRSFVANAAWRKFLYSGADRLVRTGPNLDRHSAARHGELLR